MKARLAAVALVLLTGGGAVAHADSWQIPYSLALINLNAARVYESRQSYLGALVRYETARRILGRIHAKYPQWDTITVERHMDDCDPDVMESKTQWSALQRAQAKVTYLEVLQINHPELTKAGMGEGVKSEARNVDKMIDAMLAKTGPNSPAVDAPGEGLFPRRQRAGKEAVKERGVDEVLGVEPDDQRDHEGNHLSWPVVQQGISHLCSGAGW